MRNGLVIAVMLIAFPAFAGPHDFVIQHGGAGGSQQAAQPYIDQFMRFAESALKWPANSASGVFAEKAADAEQAIEQKKPAFGILDPDVFLKFHKKYNLTPIASVQGKNQAGGSLHVVAKDPKIKELKDLKGKNVLSNQDPDLVNKLVLPEVGAKVSYSARASKGPTAVASGEADATILDDVGFAKLKEVAKDLHEVGKPVKLPPTPVVAFGAPADKDALAKMLLGMCSDPKGAEVCKNLDITKFTRPDPAAYDDAVRRYEK
jgi:ABC-type phosphate/phosphonate transport system substrate-binding protein